MNIRGPLRVLRLETTPHSNQLCFTLINLDLWLMIRKLMMWFYDQEDAYMKICWLLPYSIPNLKPPLH